jgi:hypothetical protein
MRNAAKPGRFVTAGSTKFDALIGALDLTTQGAADRLGTHRAMAHGWRHGQVRPDEAWRLRIAIWSRGIDRTDLAIEPVDWLLPEERELVQQLSAQLGAA